MTVLFVLWGIGGFVLVLFGIAGSGAFAAAMVGAAGGILWIGGMVFFGIGALLAAPIYTMSDIRSLGAYKGVNYREMVDYSIQVDTEDGTVTYPNLAAFRNDVKVRRRIAR
jgi:hypothetical protein